MFHIEGKKQKNWEQLKHGKFRLDQSLATLKDEYGSKFIVN